MDRISTHYTLNPVNDALFAILIQCLDVYKVFCNFKHFIGTQIWNCYAISN